MTARSIRVQPFRIVSRYELILDLFPIVRITRDPYSSQEEQGFVNTHAEPEEVEKGADTMPNRSPDFCLVNVGI